MKVTPNQIKNLLNNAFGFCDKYGTLYHSCFEITIVLASICKGEDKWFALIDKQNGNLQIFEFDGAEVTNGTLSVHHRNSEVYEQFNILVVATDGSNLLPQLLGE
jgi:hypothetical protein